MAQVRVRFGFWRALQSVCGGLLADHTPWNSRLARPGHVVVVVATIRLVPEGVDQAHVEDDLPRGLHPVELVLQLLDLHGGSRDGAHVAPRVRQASRHQQSPHTADFHGVDAILKAFYLPAIAVLEHEGGASKVVYLGRSLATSPLYVLPIPDHHCLPPARLPTRSFLQIVVLDARRSLKAWLVRHGLVVGAKEGDGQGRLRILQPEKGPQGRGLQRLSQNLPPRQPQSA
mmetsp:Transcript_16929/g.64466  ORF Transcript_16929/g.64466 Transcript_16929/m.64466 type:complete len:230 (+) Transcript_16929:321-1010(+)